MLDFESVPCLIWELICEFLESKDILNAGEVCKLFSKIFYHNSIWFKIFSNDFPEYSTSSKVTFLSFFGNNKNCKKKKIKGLYWKKKYSKYFLNILFKKASWLAQPHDLEETTRFYTNKGNTLEIMLTGDRDIGKTCACIWFSANVFFSEKVNIEESYRKRKTIAKCPFFVELIDVPTTVWEQALFHTTNRFQHSIICFALNDRKTYQNLGHYCEKIKEAKKSFNCTVLVGTKLDLCLEKNSKVREVSSIEAIRFCMKHGISSYFEVSSVSGTNIEEAITQAAFNQFAINEAFTNQAPNSNKKCILQ